MLRGLADCEIEQLDDDCRQDEADEKALDFIPYPGAKPLIRKLELPLQPETVVVKAETECLADRQQQKHIQKQSQRVVLKTPEVGKVAQPTGPARSQQDNHEHKPNQKVGNPQPAPDTVVAACFWSVGGSRGRAGYKTHVCQNIALLPQKWPSENRGTISLKPRLRSGRSDPTRCFSRTVLRWREFRGPTRAKRPRSTGAEAVLYRTRGTRPRLQRHSQIGR